MILKSIMIVKDRSLAALLSEKIKQNSSVELIPLVGKPMETISRHNFTVDVVFFEVSNDSLPNLEKLVNASEKFKSIVLIFGSERNNLTSPNLSDFEYLFQPIQKFQFDLIMDRILKKVCNVVLDKSMTKGDFVIKDSATKETVRLYYEEITVIEIEDKALKIHTTNGSMIESNLPLRKIHALVAHIGIFFRVHKSFIISRNHFHSVIADSIKMRHYHRLVKIGPSYREEFDSFLDSKRIR